MGAAPCVAQHEYSTGDEDLARKTTGKPRDPKPVDAELPKDGAEPEPEASGAAEPEATVPVDPTPSDSIEDAEVVSETPAPAPVEAATDTAASEDAAQTDPAPVETAPAEDASAEPAPTVDTPKPAPAPKPSILPMLLGGAVAAALGYGAHMLTQTAPAADTSALQSELASLRATVQGLDIPAPFDPADLQGQIATLAQSVAALESAAPAIDPETLAALGAQVQAVVTSSAALTTEMGALRADMDAMQADMADLRDLAETRVTAAESAVDAALARAGLDMVRAALDTGAPFDGAVAQIAQAGVAVPADLAAIAGAGIVTPDALIESFDAHARDALRASLTDLPATSTTERLGNFLRAQVGARSTAPRDGDDPDAILSRAGAAVQAGDFATALQELDALPEAGRAAMADWTRAATARAAALAALPDLTQAIAP
jgi:hypothetical protein